MPRVKDNRKKRKWELSTATIAAATNKSARVVRRDINAGKCQPWDLLSLSQYILLHALKKGVIRNETVPIPVPTKEVPVRKKTAPPVPVPEKKKPAPTKKPIVVKKGVYC